MVTTIINYCSNEFRFIKKCIDSVRPFSEQIIVPISNKFFNGQDEDSILLQKTFEENPGVDFILYEYNHDITVKYGSRFWHNATRWLGVNSIRNKENYVLFMDADEMADGDLFNEYLSTGQHKNYEAIKFNNYWYFREPIFQAKALEDSILLVRYDPVLNDQRFMLPIMERDGIFGKFENKIRNVNSIGGLPMFHHYSWVRTKEEMLRKVTSWSHSRDRDWVSLVEEEFKHPFNGSDFIHHYKFKIAENKFGIEI